MYYLDETMSGFLASLSMTQAVLLLLGLVIAVLFWADTPLRYHVKLVSFITVTALGSIILIPILIFRPNDARNIE
jgi:hypothetical protein